MNQAITALVLALVCVPALAFAARPAPAPPTIAASGYLLIDVDSDSILAAKDAEQRLEPASLTKIMTTYVVFRELRSGSIKVEGKEVPTVSISSYSRAQEVAGILKDWIGSGEFFLSEPVEPLPGVGSGLKFKPLPAKGKKR